MMPLRFLNHRDPLNSADSQELLNATHVFPGRYMFKAIGPNHDDFIDAVLRAVRLVLKHDFDPPYSLNASVGGRHVSITVEPCVDTARDVLDVYARLRTVDGLLLLL